MDSLYASIFSSTDSIRCQDQNIANEIMVYFLEIKFPGICTGFKEEGF